METKYSNTKSRGLKILSWQIQALTWEEFLKEIGPNQIWEATNGPALAGHYLHTTTHSTVRDIDHGSRIDITNSLWLPQVDSSLSDDNILVTVCVYESYGPFTRVK